MFPDVDIEVIGTILAANGGSVQRSIDSLLSMSDPTFGAQQQQQQAPTSGLVEEERRKKERRKPFITNFFFSSSSSSVLCSYFLAVPPTTSTPKDQLDLDEQLAMALQDEVFFSSFFSFLFAHFFLFF
jgi:hypothetical protein